ncbi:MAG: Crp/Fnr family transcriptional regulator [Candidatus Levyibacteriota bacterium]
MQEDPQKKLEKFFLKHKKLTYKKGSTILYADDVPAGVYYLLEGFIKDTTVSPEGQEFTLLIFEPEDIFPYQYAFNNFPNAHSFTAMTECTVVRCGREEFLSFIYQNPDILFMITQKVLIRLRAVLTRLENIAFGSAYQKVASMITILGDRFGKPENGYIKITLPLSHKDIAELLGLTRETVSIEMKKLEDQDIISKSNLRYCIKRPRKLLALSKLS